MAGLAAAGAAKSMGAIVRGFDTRYKMKKDCRLGDDGCDDDDDVFDNNT